MDQKPGRIAQLFIFATVLLDMVGFGLIIPVQPALLEQVAGTDVGQSSVLAGWLFAVYGIMQFLFGPALGSLSDAIGRRPLLLLAVFGLAVDYLLTAFAPTLWWLFAGRIFAGICGASYTIANAYVADISAPEDRARAFGLIGAAFGVGFIIGPAIGGLLGELGPRVPFFVAAGIGAMNFLLGWWLLPESLSPGKRRPFEWRRANPLGALFVFRTYRGVLPLCGALTLYMFASSAYPVIWAFWSTANFGWSERTIGLSLAVFGITMAVFQGALTGPVVKWLGERRTAVLALAIGAVIAVAYGLAPGLWTVLILLVIHGAEGLFQPAATAIMSKDVPENAQGELQGGIASAQNLAFILGTIFFSQLFGWFMRPDAPIRSPNISFFVMGALIALTIPIFLRASRPHDQAEADAARAT